MNLSTSINNSSRNEILNHLKRCDRLFIPPLSTYSDLQKYSLKLFEYSERFEIYFKKELIGLAAVYINGESAFLSNFSIEKEYIGNGLASKLIATMTEKLKENKCKFIKLEVFKINKRAIHFYLKKGFEVENEILEKVIMLKKI